MTWPLDPGGIITSCIVMSMVDRLELFANGF
jgi:hypothetical protein